MKREYQDFQESDAVLHKDNDFVLRYIKMKGGNPPDEIDALYLKACPANGDPGHMLALRLWCAFRDFLKTSGYVIQRK